MPAISRIRFTNVIYENGGKRYNDEIFLFDGHNSAFLLENGGGKTVFIQTALQAIVPHINMAERKIKDTLSLENGPAHIAIEWIINDKPRRYAMTAVSLYIENNALNSLKYTYDYDAQDSHGIEDIPFSVAVSEINKRPATRGEISDYYSRMNRQSPHANVFSTIQDYGKFIENTYKIIPSEWRKVATVNSGEGNVDEFFSKCKTTEQLLSNLLIPVVEEAIEGDHAAGFVETFERQREHFKKNRILQEKIAQSRLIKEKIDEYIAVYKDYEKERVAHQHLKQEAKTVTNYVKNQLALKQEELNRNDDNQLQLRKDSRKFEQEQKSYDLYLLKEQSSDREKELKELGERLNQEERRHDDLAQRKQNIEITIIKKDLLAEEAHLNLLKEELNQIDVRVEVADVKKQLKENSCNIKGQFVYELELIDREADRIESSITELQCKQGQVREQLDSALSYEKDLIGQRSQLEATAAMIEISENRLNAQLFGDDPEVALSLEKDRIGMRIGQLRKEKEAFQKRLEELGRYISTKSKANENLMEQKVRIKEQLSTATEQLKHLDIMMEDVRVSVEAAGYPLFMNGNIYSKEASILRELEEQRAYALLQKEKAIQQERINLRQFDIYEDLSHYMSEPLLEGIVEDLHGELEYVELGSEFISGMKTGYGLESDILFERWPFWSLTVVTSVKHTSTVREAVSRVQDRLSHMVLVVSREEASNLAMGQMADGAVPYGQAIYPDEWQTGLAPERFYEWQQSLRSMANDAIEERKNKEMVFSGAEALLGRTRQFFTDYPYDHYEALKGTIAGGETELKQVAMDLQALDLGIREDQDSRLKINAMLNGLNLEAQSLDSRLRIIEQLEVEQQHADVTEQKLSKVLKRSSELAQQIKGYGITLNSIARELEEAKSDFRRFETEKERILNLELYQEVKTNEPYGTNASLASLKEQRTILKNRLTGLSRSRQEIEERLLEHSRLEGRYRQALQRKEHEAQYPVFDVDAYYELEADDLYDKIIESERSVNALIQQYRQIEKDQTRIATRCQVLEESLERDYTGVVHFDIESQHIQQRLRIEKATLGDRTRKLNRERQTIENTIRRLDTVSRELEIKDGAYHYMALDIEPLTLSLDYFEGYDDAPEGPVRELISSLEGQFSIVRKAHNRVMEKQESVMTYCRNNITDRRLLETLATGLNSKNDWQALLIYQEKMTEIILKIIKVAEDDKRESDIELQTFLSHLMTYVKSVATELDTIQTKTRITIEDQVKQIFVFDIPEFDEEEAKLALRNYIDETILYYEKESLHESVDDESLRRTLSERLSVMRLLEVVMKEHAIKVKCRKVTNDMRINKTPMTWESSNKWSGGEKWSKNMTLFLSILNYLAEKKQHLSPNQKRQRSVILDNPFGKASSDHVLKPVFMVADKLGFQIIALTAHAEGKFISEYFPVVYSCRLRKTTDPTKQIMTNEKMLNHAYLREHSPMTMMRMQEVEQISLF